MLAAHLGDNIPVCPQVPDLRLSQEELDYGSVQTGKAGVVTLQLHNYKQVPCEWSLKRPLEASKSKDWAFFVVEPPEGVLEPDQKVNVRVIFTPVLGREAPYLQVTDGDVQDLWVVVHNDPSGQLW